MVDISWFGHLNLFSKAEGTLLEMDIKQRHPVSRHAQTPRSMLQGVGRNQCFNGVLFYWIPSPHFEA